MINKSRYNPTLRILSLLVALSFALESVSFAAPEIKLAQAVFFQAPQPSLELPKTVATLGDVYKGKSGKTLILVQDAHTNESGQLNISKALQEILRQEKIHYVFLEAADGNSSLASVRTKASLAQRKTVAREYLRKGLLDGIEYLDLTSETDFTPWGVEDKQLYWQSLKAYEKVAQGREKFQAYLQQVALTIETLKPQTYGPSLLAFDVQRNAFLDEKISLTEYIDVLIKEAGAANIALTHYPHLSALKGVKDKEGKIDFEKANREQAEAMAFLSQEDRAMLAETASVSKVSANEHRTQKAFYALLEAKVRISNFPELAKYIGYLKAAESLDARLILEERTAIEEEVYASRSEEEKELHRADNSLTFLQSLLDLTVTPQEFRVYKQDKGAYDVTALTGFLNRKIMDLRDRHERVVFLEEGFEEHVKTAEEFYRLTYQRDIAFIDNALAHMEKTGEDKAVLIAGGYHTPNLSGLLRDKGISYIVVTPQILQETNRKKYENVLLGQDEKEIFGKKVETPADALDAWELSQRPMTSAPMLNRLNSDYTKLTAARNGKISTPPTGARLAMKPYKEMQFGPDSVIHFNGTFRPVVLAIARLMTANTFHKDHPLTVNRIVTHSPKSEDTFNDFTVEEARLILSYIAFGQDLSDEDFDKGFAAMSEDDGYVLNRIQEVYDIVSAMRSDTASFEKLRSQLNDLLRNPLGDRYTKPQLYDAAITRALNVLAMVGDMEKVSGARLAETTSTIRLKPRWSARLNAYITDAIGEPWSKKPIFDVVAIGPKKIDLRAQVVGYPDADMHYIMVTASDQRTLKNLSTASIRVRASRGADGTLIRLRSILSQAAKRPDFDFVSSFPQLAKTLQERPSGARLSVMDWIKKAGVSLGVMKDGSPSAKAVDRLIEKIESKGIPFSKHEESVRSSIIALGNYPSQAGRIVPVLEEVIEHHTGAIQITAIEAMGRLKDKKALPILHSLLKEASTRTGVHDGLLATLRALGEIASPESVWPIHEVVSHAIPPMADDIYAAGIEALAKIGPASVPSLMILRHLNEIEWERDGVLAEATFQGWERHNKLIRDLVDGALPRISGARLSADALKNDPLLREKYAVKFIKVKKDDTEQDRIEGPIVRSEGFLGAYPDAEIRPRPQGGVSITFKGPAEILPHDAANLIELLRQAHPQWIFDTTPAREGTEMKISIWEELARGSWGPMIAEINAHAVKGALVSIDGSPAVHVDTATTYLDQGRMDKKRVLVLTRGERNDLVVSYADGARLAEMGDVASSIRSVAMDLRRDPAVEDLGVKLDRAVNAWDMDKARLAVSSVKRDLSALDKSYYNPFVTELGRIELVLSRDSGARLSHVNGFFTDGKDLEISLMRGVDRARANQQLFEALTRLDIHSKFPGTSVDKINTGGLVAIRNGKTAGITTEIVDKMIDDAISTVPFTIEVKQVDKKTVENHRMFYVTLVQARGAYHFSLVVSGDETPESIKAMLQMKQIANPGLSMYEFKDVVVKDLQDISEMAHRLAQGRGEGSKDAPEGARLAMTPEDLKATVKEMAEELGVTIHALPVYHLGATSYTVQMQVPMSSPDEPATRDPRFLKLLERLKERFGDEDFIPNLSKILANESLSSEDFVPPTWESKVRLERFYYVSTRSFERTAGARLAQGVHVKGDREAIYQAIETYAQTHRDLSIALPDGQRVNIGEYREYQRASLLHHHGVYEGSRYEVKTNSDEPEVLTIVRSTGARLAAIRTPQPLRDEQPYRMGPEEGIEFIKLYLQRLGIPEATLAYWTRPIDAPDKFVLSLQFDGEDLYHRSKDGWSRVQVQPDDSFVLLANGSLAYIPASSDIRKYAIDGTYLTDIAFITAEEVNAQVNWAGARLAVDLHLLNDFVEKHKLNEGSTQMSDDEATNAIISALSHSSDWRVDLDFLDQVVPLKADYRILEKILEPKIRKKLTEIVSKGSEITIIFEPETPSRPDQDIYGVPYPDIPGRPEVLLINGEDFSHRTTPEEKRGASFGTQSRWYIDGYAYAKDIQAIKQEFSALGSEQKSKALESIKIEVSLLSWISFLKRHRGNELIEVLAKEMANSGARLASKVSQLLIQGLNQETRFEMSAVEAISKARVSQQISRAEKIRALNMIAAYAASEKVLGAALNAFTRIDGRATSLRGSALLRIQALSGVLMTLSSDGAGMLNAALKLGLNPDNARNDLKRSVRSSSADDIKAKIDERLLTFVESDDPIERDKLRSEIDVLRTVLSGARATKNGFDEEPLFSLSSWNGKGYAQNVAEREASYDESPAGQREGAILRELANNKKYSEGFRIGVVVDDTTFIIPAMKVRGGNVTLTSTQSRYQLLNQIFKRAREKKDLQGNGTLWRFTETGKTKYFSKPAGARLAAAKVVEVKPIKSDEKFSKKILRSLAGGRTNNDTDFELMRELMDVVDAGGSGFTMHPALEARWIQGQLENALQALTIGKPGYVHADLMIAIRAFLSGRVDEEAVAITKAILATQILDTQKDHQTSMAVLEEVMTFDEGDAPIKHTETPLSLVDAQRAKVVQDAAKTGSDKVIHAVKPQAFEGIRDRQKNFIARSASVSPSAKGSARFFMTIGDKKVHSKIEVSKRDSIATYTHSVYERNEEFQDWVLYSTHEIQVAQEFDAALAAKQIVGAIKQMTLDSPNEIGDIIARTTGPQYSPKYGMVFGARLAELSKQEAIDAVTRFFQANKVSGRVSDPNVMQGFVVIGQERLSGPNLGQLLLFLNRYDDDQFFSIAYDGQKMTVTPVTLSNWAKFRRWIAKQYHSWFSGPQTQAPQDLSGIEPLVTALNEVIVKARKIRSLSQSAIDFDKPVFWTKRGLSAQQAQRQVEAYKAAYGVVESRLQEATAASRVRRIVPVTPTRWAYYEAIRDEAKRAAASPEGARLALQKIDPTKTEAWKMLAADIIPMRSSHLRTHFTVDPDRAHRFTREFESGDTSLYVDLSKNLITQRVLNHLIALARATHLDDSIQQMFAGERINETEPMNGTLGRPVLHTALRSPAGSEVIVDGRNVVPDVQAELAHMKQFVEEIHSGRWKGYLNDEITDIVNIGIGGSDLGPVMVTEALKPFKTGKVRVHFISNVDGTDFQEKVVKAGLNPNTTLFIIASKTFTTQETMTNAETAKRWFLAQATKFRGPLAIGSGNEVMKKHFVALSTNREAVERFGIDPANMFQFWDWVGGRYSLWSAIGLSVMADIGYDNFMELLAGAHDMDEHFKNTPFDQNIPVLMGLLSIWYTNFYDAQTHAILPYDQYLHRFAAYLQQGWMESNGKSVDRSGNKIGYKTSPVIFGEPGTNGQHSFFQLLHQGTGIVPADFIGVKESHNAIGDHHKILLSNFFAQTEALAFGKTLEEVLAEGVHPTIAPQRVFDGNKPTTTILINKMTPRSLGALIAMYEHQIFVEGAVLNLFSFDQWGVELGKKQAGPILKDLTTGTVAPTYSSSTQALLKRVNGARLSMERMSMDDAVNVMARYKLEHRQESLNVNGFDIQGNDSQAIHKSLQAYLYFDFFRVKGDSDWLALPPFIAARHIRKVLIVTDDESLERLYEINLRKTLRGLDVLTARSPGSAVELASQNDFDLILNAVTPAFRGVTKAVMDRTRQSSSHVPFTIYFSGADPTDSMTVYNNVRAGLESVFLMKPKGISGLPVVVEWVSRPMPQDGARLAEDYRKYIDNPLLSGDFTIDLRMAMKKYGSATEGELASGAPEREFNQTVMALAKAELGRMVPDSDPKKHLEETSIQEQKPPMRRLNFKFHTRGGQVTHAVVNDGNRGLDLEPWHVLEGALAFVEGKDANARAILARYRLIGPIGARLSFSEYKMLLDLVLVDDVHMASSQESDHAKARIRSHIQSDRVQAEALLAKLKGDDEITIPKGVTRSDLAAKLEALISGARLTSDFKTLDSSDQQWMARNLGVVRDRVAERIQVERIGVNNAVDKPLLLRLSGLQGGLSNAIFSINNDDIRDLSPTITKLKVLAPLLDADGFNGSAALSVATAIEQKIGARLTTVAANTSLNPLKRTVSVETLSGDARVNLTIEVRDAYLSVHRSELDNGDADRMDDLFIRMPIEAGNGNEQRIVDTLAEVLQRTVLASGADISRIRELVSQSVPALNVASTMSDDRSLLESAMTARTSRASIDARGLFTQVAAQIAPEMAIPALTDDSALIEFALKLWEVLGNEAAFKKFALGDGLRVSSKAEVLQFHLFGPRGIELMVVGAQGSARTVVQIADAGEALRDLREALKAGTASEISAKDIVAAVTLSIMSAQLSLEEILETSPVADSQKRNIVGIPVSYFYGMDADKRSIHLKSLVAQVRLAQTSEKAFAGIFFAGKQDPNAAPALIRALEEVEASEVGIFQDPSKFDGLVGRLKNPADTGQVRATNEFVLHVDVFADDSVAGWAKVFFLSRAFSVILQKHFNNGAIDVNALSVDDLRSLTPFYQTFLKDPKSFSIAALVKSLKDQELSAEEIDAILLQLPLLKGIDWKVLAQGARLMAIAGSSA